VSRVWVLVVGLGIALAGRGGAQTLPDQDLFDHVLAAVVRDGLVDYAALAAQRTDLDVYLAALGHTSPADLDLVSRDERLAFWINAYNACALRLVIDHYPIEERHGPTTLRNQQAGIPSNSVRQIPDALTRRFCRVAQRDRSLDGIEHGVLRPLGEPRIHFVLHDGARGGPILTDVAYRGDRLEEQLDAAVRRFVADTSLYVLVRGHPPVLRVSKILDWYKDDFGGTRGVVAFLRRFAPPADAELLQPGQVRVEYDDYDWTLDDTAVGGAGR